MTYQPSSISPHVASSTRVCSDCWHPFPVAQVIEYHPVPGLTMYRCSPCNAVAQKGDSVTDFPRPITRAQFEHVREMLESSRKKTRPRRHDLYDVLCLILHREQTGLSWRQLPTVVPWRTAHEYQMVWSMPPRDGGAPLLDRIHKILKENP